MTHHPKTFKETQRILIELNSSQIILPLTVFARTSLPWCHFINLGFNINKSQDVFAMILRSSGGCRGKSTARACHSRLLASSTPLQSPTRIEKIGYICNICVILLLMIAKDAIRGREEGARFSLSSPIAPLSSFPLPLLHFIPFMITK